MAKRRAHGDGGLFVRGRGTDHERWVGRITLADGTRRDVYGRTQAEARRKLEGLKRAASLGMRLTSVRQTTGEFLIDWLVNTAKPALRPTTYRAYETRVRVYLVPRIGKIPLNQLTSQHVQDLQNALLHTPRLPRNRVGAGFLSPATVLDTRRVLGKALGQAAKWGLIARNPVPLVDPPSVHRAETQPFNLAQARTLLETLKGDRLEALYTVVLALGLRRGEALGLMWDDIDVQGGTIRIQRALYRADGRLQLMDVKTPKSRRTIALPQFALRALDEHRRRQADERHAAQDLWVETGLVFSTHTGTALEPRNINRHFAAVLKSAGLPHQRFHDLRHACATLMLVQGQDLKVVQEVLGHSSIATTGNVYAHVLMGLKRQAAAGMDALFDSPERGG